jgi:uncharacterized lipoprotein YbaY
MTTVGYGHRFPITSEGRLIAVIETRSAHSAGSWADAPILPAGEVIMAFSHTGFALWLAAVSTAASAPTINGTAAHHSRSALPVNAIFVATLEDVLRADASQPSV